jgi:hypothetical protein
MRLRRTLYIVIDVVTGLAYQRAISFRTGACPFS